MLLTLLRLISPPPKDERPKSLWVFPVLLAIITCAKLAFVSTTPMRALVMSPWLLDDSFITMQVAKNIAHLAKFSFDGVHLTTGVAPLWTYIIALPLLSPEKDVAIRMILWMSTLLGAGCAFAVYRMALRLGDSNVGAIIAGMLATLMPVPFFNAMNGMETAFFSLLILLAFAGAAGALRYDHRTLVHTAWTGVFLGLAILTRADAIFAVAAVGLWKVWEWWSTPKRRHGVATEAIVLGVIVAVFFIAFFAWQTVQTGSPFPDNQVGRRAIALEDHGFDFARFAFVPYLKISLWNVFQLESLWSLATGSALVSVLAMAWACTRERTRPLATVGIMYVAIFSAVLCFYQWYFPDFHGLRYINAGAHLAILFTTLLVAELFKGYGRQTALCAFCIILLGLSWYRFADTVRHYASLKDMALFGQTNIETQGRFWAAIDWVKTNVPEDGVIALRDHGRMAFFTDRTIQDLAGILDGDVLLHRDDGTLGAYLLERNVSYVFLPDPAPWSVSIYQRVHDALRLERVLGAPNQEISGYKPYKVLGPRS